MLDENEVFTLIKTDWGNRYDFKGLLLPDGETIRTHDLSVPIQAPDKVVRTLSGRSEEYEVLDSYVELKMKDLEPYYMLTLKRI